MDQKFKHEYNKLNEQQKNAVDYIDGPLLVLAGPGTGKTQLLSLRAANILRQTDSDPSTILCLTFTEAAAYNMRQRLISLVGKVAEKIEIYTFHGFGAHIIQSYNEYFEDEHLIKSINDFTQYEILQEQVANLGARNRLARKSDGIYLHLNDLLKVLGWFKQAGLEPQDIKKECVQNISFLEVTKGILTDTFLNVPSPKYLEQYELLAKELKKLAKLYSCSISNTIIQDLDNALLATSQSDRYAPEITKWRNRWVTPTKSKQWQFADYPRYTLYLDVATLYEKYQKELTQRGLFTYDDMILKTSHQLRKSEELQLKLQEKYQYVMVDEYQDTNNAQNTLLEQLGENSINERQPNIMVVGDDDQAIYRFQGSDSSLIKRFIEKWANVKVISVSENYRSGKIIIELSNKLIGQSQDRASDKVLSINKMTDANRDYAGEITQISTNTEEGSYITITDYIKELLKHTQPSEIAVLAPRHSYLESLTQFLLADNIPINYEHREHVLDQPKIIELLDLVELIVLLQSGKTSNAESLLPKILSARYWQLSPDEIWKLSISARQKGNSWLDSLASSQNKQLNELYRAIKVIVRDSNTESANVILSELMGNRTVDLGQDEIWRMPWRNFYFSESELVSKPNEYMNFIGELRTLENTYNDSLEERNTVGNPTILDFYGFVNAYRQSKLTLINSQQITIPDAVQLMTVYKAKGLEWKHVIVLNCQENVWGSKVRQGQTSIPLPYSLKFVEPALTNEADFLRLLYVAITRAKDEVILSTYDNVRSSPVEKMHALTDALDKLPVKAINESKNSITIARQLEHAWYDPITNPSPSLYKLLEPTLSNYRISATHLNDFLSLKNGGPKYFMLRHLLKVPDTVNVNAFYGSVVHKSIEYVHDFLTKNHELPSTSELKKYFSIALSNAPLLDSEIKELHQRGDDELLSWYKANLKHFSVDDISEYNFSGQDVRLGSNIKLTGKIDAIKLNDRSVQVIDYKTSQPLHGWLSKNKYESIRAYEYKRQLIFYKLLMENSDLFKNKTVESGIISFIPKSDENIYFELKYNFDDEEVKRFTMLLKSVWSHITNLKLPDISSYPDNISGIKAFENYLISREKA